MTLPYPLARELHGVRFILLAPPDSNQARFTFTGRRQPWMTEAPETQQPLTRLQNQEIVWDATLLTLAHFHAEQLFSAQPTVRSAFIDIGDESASGHALRVVLDIPYIDEVAILRTIIMIRNYKRLHPGRHEFGESRCFPPR